MGVFDSEKRKKSFFGNPLQVHYVGRLTILISGSSDEWSLSQEIEYGMAAAQSHTKHFPASVITFNTFLCLSFLPTGLSWDQLAYSYRNFVPHHQILVYMDDDEVGVAATHNANTAKV